ncbi:hypothetical protein F5Y14DRAFT_424151, partial [Nemania sp. NC0429]
MSVGRLGRWLGSVTAASSSFAVFATLSCGQVDVMSCQGTSSPCSYILTLHVLMPILSYRFRRHHSTYLILFLYYI